MPTGLQLQLARKHVGSVIGRGRGYRQEPSVIVTFPRALVAAVAAM